MPIRLGAGEVSALYVGAAQVARAYLGDRQCWPAKTPQPPAGKVDPAHPLANRTVLKRLEGGALQGMTGDTRAAAVDGALATTTAGTETYAFEALPSVPASCRVSAVIKVTKTAGRQSFVGLTRTATAAGAGAAAQIGYRQGTGFQLTSADFAFGSTTLLPDASCVDGARYRVTLAYDNAVSAAGGRVVGTVQNLDGTIPAGLAVQWLDRLWPAATYPPRAVLARTNTELGAISDLTYVDSLLGVAEADAQHLIRTFPLMGDGSAAIDRAAIWATAKAAPLRVVVTAGGAGQHGGAIDWGTSSRLPAQPYAAQNAAWKALADAGYTVVHPQALHDGWGADDHLAKNKEALDRIRAAYGSDVRVYYLGYSMGGLSTYRAIMGRAGFPPIRAAYIVAGATDLNAFTRANIPALVARWPDPALYDSPVNFDPAELVARGTRVRSVHSTADFNVPKADNHDRMKAKYESVGSDLFSERVVNVAHFDPAYWDTHDIVTFFEQADAQP